jgi:hypothetical protein
MGHPARQPRQNDLTEGLETRPRLPFCLVVTIARLGQAWMVAVLVLVCGCAAEGPSAEPERIVMPGSAPAFGEPIDCNATEDDELPSTRRERAHFYWAEDAELRAALVRAIARINTATGLGLAVAAARDAVLVTRLELPEGVLGYASDHIELDAALTGEQLDATLIHEIGHTQGANHLGTGEGIMARCMGDSNVLLTDPDLIQICSGAPCTTFVPEYRPELAAVAR